MTTPSRVVYAIGTAAPPVRDLHRLFELLHQRGWQPSASTPSGISDTLALDLLNELLATEIPMIAAPCVKAPLHRHPAYAASIKTLEDSVVTVLDSDRTVLRPKDGQVTLDWSAVAAALDD